jgi:hypothetical protein
VSSTEPKPKSQRKLKGWWYYLIDSDSVVKMIAYRAVILLTADTMVTTTNWRGEGIPEVEEKWRSSHWIGPVPCCAFYKK